MDTSPSVDDEGTARSRSLEGRIQRALARAVCVSGASAKLDELAEPVRIRTLEMAVDVAAADPLYEKMANAVMELLSAEGAVPTSKEGQS